MLHGSRRPDAERNCETLIDVMQALHAPIRCEILFALAAGERDVTAITGALELDIANVSHNLSKLRENALIVRRIVHRRHYYQLAPCVRATIDGAHIELTVTAEDGDTVTLNTTVKPRRNRG